MKNIQQYKKEVDVIFEILEQELKLNYEEIISSSRKLDVIDARKIFSKICKDNLPKITLTEIGSFIGNRDHSTICNALKNHDSHYDNKAIYTQKFNSVNYKFLINKIIQKQIQDTIKELKNKKIKLINKIESQILRLKDNLELDLNVNKKIGLFFGEFNPIDNIDLVIANTALSFCDFDEIWFVIKNRDNSFLSAQDRFALIKSCIIDNPFFKVSNIELKMEGVFNTHDVLQKFTKKYNYKFSLILSSEDAINYFKEGYMIDDVYFYNKYDNDVKNKIIDLKLKDTHFIKLNLPLNTKINSEDIRSIIRSNDNIQSLRYVIPNECIYIIEKKGFYKIKVHQEN
jgi:nicotinate-nucleotide adenylyltransferase